MSISGRRMCVCMELFAAVAAVIDITFTALVPVPLETSSGPFLDAALTVARARVGSRRQAHLDPPRGTG